MGADYLLASSQTERERLRLQALVWEDAATALFEHLPVLPGWKCVDVGCGAVGVLRPLSRLVGATGSVVGADVDASLLAAAAEFVAENELTNVSLQQANIFTDDLPAGAFDLVHLRFMLAPLGRSEELLARALRLCKPGGLIVVEEPDASCWSLLPPSTAFSQLRDLIIEAFASSGGDFNVGRRTFELLGRAGAENVNVRAAVHALPPLHPYLRVVLQFAASLRPRIISSNLASPAGLDMLVDEVERILNASACAGITFLVTQVWGVNPISSAA